MPSIQVVNAEFHFGDRPIFEKLNLHLSSGWTGVVGANGVGKSTLLRILTGQWAVDGGHIRRIPRSMTHAYCEQHTWALSAEIRAFDARSDRVAQRLKAQLELQSEQLQRWSTLSPGERRRWQVGAALGAAPDVLVLDEPTNDLDQAAKDLLRAALVTFEGVGLIASHDRALLDATTTSTIRVVPGRVEHWPQPFGLAQREWVRATEQGRREHARAKGEARKLKERMAADRRSLQCAAGKLNARRRMKSRQDHDARSMAAKGKVEKAVARRARAVSTLKTRVARAVEEVVSNPQAKALGASVFARFEPSPRRLLFSAPAGGLSVDARPTLTVSSLCIERGSRIRIDGPNGAGKSTFLEALHRSLVRSETRHAYVRQEISQAEANAMLDGLRQTDASERGRVLQIVAALGVDPALLLASRAPSPGEARKLLIAHALMTQAHCLLLDEPTNHLDLPSIQRLEEALSAFPGALVLVSHDEVFAEACTDTTWWASRRNIRADPSS